jgi:hypothetical protein
MNKFSLLTLLVSLLLLHHNAYNQRLREFSENQDTFKSEFITFMGPNLNEKQGAELTGFFTLWDSAYFSTNEMEGIIKTANLYLSRNARPVPHMINFIRLLSLIAESDKERRHFPVWTEAFDDLLIKDELSITRLNELIISTTGLLSSGILYQSSYVLWKADRSSFQYDYKDSLKVVFENIDLIASSHTDTMYILNTSGTLCHITNSWKGNGGMVTWERAGLDPADIYALLNKYSIDLTRSQYDADSVMFRYAKYLPDPLIGNLIDRLTSTGSENNASYPRFTSYGQEFNIKDIYPGVDYEGGLSMEGIKMIGSGDDQKNARLSFYRDGERWLTAESDYFVFRPQGINSASSSILFSIENDSVFHPDVQLNYLSATKELSINQNDKIISQSPWFNKYHQVDMSFSQLLWKTDENKIRLTMPRASSIGNANFESLRYFDPVQYQRMQGMDLNHPLLLLRNFANQWGSPVIPAAEYARSIRKTLPQVRRQLLELTLQGFIFYDTDTDMIRLRSRLFHFLQANSRRIDYDIINFSSTTNAPVENALIDLRTFEMKVNGIPRVFISRTQNVNLFPANNTVTLKRNRNFNFDGIINAGNLSFSGINFDFDYDSYEINLQNIDSISLRAWLEERDMYGDQLLTDVKNLIRNLTGRLYIDQPDNKSGRINNPDFPRFTSTGNSYVFYDKPYIQKGVYKEESFFFELEPFEMDSLSRFRNESLQFKGKLVSAGIFPDIKENLTLQEDFSLGINFIIPATGIEAYGGKGILYDQINLSNRGLKGDGRLEYLTTVLYADDFLFLPDSMNTVTNEFVVRKQTTGVEFPSARSKNNLVQWLPYDDKMSVLQTDNSFELFDEQAELHGSLTVRPSGLTGSGTINLLNASISSDIYSLRSESFHTDSCNLELKIPENEIKTMTGNDLAADVDFKSRQGSFSRNQGAGSIHLPINRYIADPESFNWKMDDQRIEFVSSVTDTITGQQGAKYISAEHGQDSLSFFSSYAVLDYRYNMLRADKVKYIEVADALIYPFGETISIAEKARMLPLKEAQIVVNTENSLHEFYNASIEISGKNNYGGSGNYDYIDEQDVAHTINFDNISVNSDIETVASGRIQDDDYFMLNPRFSFSGEVHLKASRPFLNFRGSTSISHNCQNIISHPIIFENEINPQEVLIPVAEQNFSAERERIYSGIAIATDSVHIYPSFLTTRRSWSDQLIIGAEGYMKFDKSAGEYRIGSYEKLQDPDIAGNFITFNLDECIIAGEGRLELGVTMGQVEISATGHVENVVNINETTLSGIISLDFFLSDDALSIIAQQADSLPGQPFDSSAYYYNRGLNEILGQERAEYYRNLSDRAERQREIPDELLKTFVLSDVNMKWNKESRSYRSHGEIGIAFINGVPVNKLFTGYLEITKRRSGDFFDLYIELDDNNWYYFGYTRGVMQTFSSNRNYVGIIDDLPLRQRRQRVSGRETRFTYMLATDTKLEQFFSNYRRHLQGQPAILPDGDSEDEE